MSWGLELMICLACSLPAHKARLAWVASKLQPPAPLLQLETAETEAQQAVQAYKDAIDTAWAALEGREAK